MSSSTAKLVRGTVDHREFIKRLSAEVFSRFGNYEEMLPGMLASSKVRTVVAEADGEAVGFAMYSLEDVNDGEIDLSAIAVRPSWQSRGLGRRLLAYVEAETRSLVRNRSPVVRLNVAEGNMPARKLFERSGYVPIVEERGSYPQGQRSIALYKRIGEAVEQADRLDE
jgi:ribosomal protein S18 acetylase RimI-like enzyme